MLYNIFLPLASKWHLANLMTYITFRSGLAILCSLIISFIIGPKIIAKLKSLQKKGQPIREDGPDSHFAKAGTPTMGGLIIIASTLFSVLLLANLANPYVWIIIFVMLAFGMLGFLDDYTKVSKFNYRGITGKKKMLLQFIVSLGAHGAHAY